MTPVRLEPAAPRSRHKHSTTELPEFMFSHLADSYLFHLKKCFEKILYYASKQFHYGNVHQQKRLVCIVNLIISSGHDFLSV